MAYEKLTGPSTVYHLTQKGNLTSILDDGVIRRFDDTECWFCESLEKMKAYMAQTVLCEGKPYYAVGGQLRRYPKFVPEAYVLLKLTPRGCEDNWYRWNQEVPPGSPRELVQAAKEFSMLKIGYRGDMAFKEPEVIDVPKFLAGEIVSHKKLTTNEARHLLFERTENEMAAFMRQLDCLTRDELIQSAEEITAMQVCHRGLMVEREKLARRKVLPLLQVDKPLRLLSEVWIEQQNAGELRAFSQLLAGLNAQKRIGDMIEDDQPRTVKQMLETCPNNCFLFLMPLGILNLSADEAEKILRGEKDMLSLENSEYPVPITAADLMEMVITDMWKDEHGCWCALTAYPHLLEELGREMKMKG